MTDKMLGSVLSTRIRLARNIKDIPFPTRMNAAQANAVAKKVYASLGSGYKLYNIARLGESEAGALVERHLISKELIGCKYGSVAVSDDESVSVMLGEEDHVREQVILKGYRLDDAYRIADALDDRIAEKVRFAYSPDLGYLTACPTNLGTGMRASVMMFLPALTMTDKLGSSAGALNLLDITVRGVYGEGSDATGYVYQISNQRTLGVKEDEILRLVATAADNLADAEAKARDLLLATRTAEVKDEILRAYGIATSAYKMTNRELISSVALIKLGAYYDILGVSNIAAVDNLLTSMQPYNLVASSDVPLSGAEDRDVYRAAVVRGTLRSLLTNKVV